MDKGGSESVFSVKEEFVLNDEKKSRQEDETSLSSAEDNLIQSSNKSNFVSENIRFTPKVIEFVSAFEGKQYSKKFSIQNIGRNPVLVQFGYPSSFRFQLKNPTQSQKLLPSGTSITKIISYTHHNEGAVLKSQIPLKINGITVKIPIIVKEAQPEIHVVPQKLNFQAINLGASAKSLTLTIHNTGDRRTKFEIDCGKNYDLMVSPMRGTVKPRQPVSVCVDIMGFTEGEYYQELWIKTTETPIRVPVLVEVVRPRLEIAYPLGTESYTLINFKPTFVGAQRVCSFILKNISVETTLFVVLAELNEELQLLKEARKLSDNFKCFEITAEEGQLEPLEERIFNVVFHPKSKTPKKGWKHIEEEKKFVPCNNVVFFRIKVVHGSNLKELARVGISEIFHLDPNVEEKSISQLDHKPESSNSKSTEHHSNSVVNSSHNNPPPYQHKALRLCIHGEAIEPDFTIQPSSLDFGDLVVAQTENKVIRVTNNNIIPVKCRFYKKVNVRIQPQEAWLKGEKAEEFLISLTPSFAGNFETELKVQLLSQSDIYYTSDKTMVTIAEYNVHLSYKARDVTTPLTPKIGLGITPLLKDPVGIYKELITYKDIQKCPRAAMLGLKQGFKPEWMRREIDQVNKVENAMIAFPNDRGSLFPSLPKEKICRTIFKGFYRYAPPDDLTYTLSPEGRIEKMERRTAWIEYIFGRLKKENHSCISELECLNENFVWKKNLKSYPKFIQKTEQSKTTRAPETTLVPLSPLFLHQIEVEPKLMNFGLVAIASKAEETIGINNMNPFPISVKFISGNANVWMLQNGTNTVQPNTTAYVQTCFRAEEFGQFFGFLNYEINGSHRFDIPISALVLPKSLILHGKNFTFGINDEKEVFQPNSLFIVVENVLQTPIQYQWTVPDDTVFNTRLREGEIQPRFQQMTEFYLDLKPRRSFFSEITFISESGGTESVKISHPWKKIAVDFLDNRINMNDIPLNLPTTAHPVISNSCYHDVCFEVLSLNPMPGVTVEPKEGVVKARGCLPLQVVVQVPVAVQFTFKIIIRVHFYHKITVTITGNVVLPKVRIVPKEMVLKKICQHSFDIWALCFVNDGTTLAEVSLDFTNYSEFEVEGPRTITIPPNKAEKMLFRFKPVNISQFVFYLPVVINNILGPPSLQKAESELASYYITELNDYYEQYGTVLNPSNKVKIPCVSIKCSASKALLQISPTALNFRTECNIKTQFIEIKNVSEEEVTFCIRTDDLGEVNNSPFNIVPVPATAVENRLKSIKAHLNPGQKLVLSVTFEPKKHSDYEIEVPVFVRGYNNGFVYNFIRLKGRWDAPRLYPRSSEVYFGPVPLGVCCETILKIHAENYRSPETIFSLFCNSSEKDSEQIQYNWLDEPYLEEGSKTFQLQITFRSCVPISLRKYIILFDSLGGYATILVTATADNCSLTTHTFLSTRTNKYKLIREPEPEPKPEPLKHKSKEAEPKIESNPKRSEIEVASSSKVNEQKIEIKQSQDVLDKAKSKSSLKFKNSRDKTDEKLVGKSAIEFKEKLSKSEDGTGLEPLEKGPKLVVQMTKSMTRITQLGFANVISTTGDGCKSPKEARISRDDTHISLTSQINIAASSKHLFNRQPSKVNSTANEFTFPNFPKKDQFYWQYFQNTLGYVERWIYEVVMKCSQYLTIPRSFQQLNDLTKSREKEPGKSSRHKKTDFLVILKEFIENDILPERQQVNEEPSLERSRTLYNLFLENLQLLETRGCFLSHIRPEYLMKYEDYVCYTKYSDNMEVFLWEFSDTKQSSSVKILEDHRTQSQVIEKNKPEKDELIKTFSVSISKDFWSKSSLAFFHQVDEESEKEERKNSSKNDVSDDATKVLEFTRRFEHLFEVLDRPAFELRSTQAWLDIFIQIFRVLVLPRAIKRKPASSNSDAEKISLNCGDNDCATVSVDKIGYYFSPNPNERPDIDSYTNNVYSSQERILLSWMKDHLEAQKNVLWKNKTAPSKVLNNFTKDLSDSVVLISLTASYCPYIVPYFFKDIFPNPETDSMIHHNAAKLILAWRTLRLGLTVETEDIIHPNPVFMIILLTHLYQVLPSLHPISLIRITAPLNSETSKKIQIENNSNQKLSYEVKFFGEHERFLQIKESQPFVIGPSRTKAITIVFSARQIRKISAVLILCGVIESPNFGQHAAFILEGSPSELTEWEKFSFSAPLYKVICSEISIKSPYEEPAVYEVYYATQKPEYSDNPDSTFKPWSEIWNRKVSRRLFLEKSSVKIENDSGANLGITIACLTQYQRFFWLLFKSEIGAFIIQIEITPKLKEALTDVLGYMPVIPPESSCSCLSKNPPKINIGCPFVVMLNIPARNEPLRNALKRMFFKALNGQEKAFWSQYFEKDIGIRLLLWLMDPNEDEEVVDEFVETLNTRVTYTLFVDPADDRFAIPMSIEIPDVTEKSEIPLPIHLSQNAPQELSFSLTMVSESESEIRTLRVKLLPNDSRSSSQRTLHKNICSFVCRS